MLYKYSFYLLFKFISIVKKIFEYFFHVNSNYIHYWLIAERAMFKKKDPIIIEIGAHIGNDTDFFQKNYKNIEVTAFEPDPRNIKILKKRFSLNNKITIHECALSNKFGKMNFFLNIENKINSSKDSIIEKLGFDANELSGSASSSLITPYHLTGEKVLVDVKKLDDFIEFKDRNIFLFWIDVQGAERMVIEGSRKYINYALFIWIEYGEIDYPSAMTRDQTIDCFKDTHYVINFLSNHSSKGNLLLKKFER